MNRTVLAKVVVAAGLVCASFSMVAHADPKASAVRQPKAAPVAAPPPRPKPAPAPAAKDQPKHDAGGAATAAAATGHEVVQQESRIEFDERMVRGQSATGAIFLFQRAPSDFKSIVEVPDSFRSKTIELVKPHRGAP